MQLRKLAAIAATTGLLASSAFAGHLKEPSLKGQKPLVERGVYSLDCDDGNRVDVEGYLIGDDKVQVFYLNDEKNPFGMYVSGDDKVWYDSLRLGHMRGVGKIGEEPVGSGPCDLVKDLPK